MEHRYRILFTVALDVDKVCTDAFYVVDMQRLVAAAAMTKLTGEADMYAVEVKNTYNGINLRSRLATTGGLHNIHTDELLTRDELDAVLASHEQGGTLREFLKQARI